MDDYLPFLELTFSKNSMAYAADTWREGGQNLPRAEGSLPEKLIPLGDRLPPHTRWKYDGLIKDLPAVDWH